MKMKTKKNNSDSKKKIGQEVYEKLKEEICNLRLKPGEPLFENKIAERYSVSRTPVREAFNKLAQEGLVQLVKDRGAFVAEIDPRIIHEIFVVRQALEGLAARLATLNIPEYELDALERKVNKNDLSWKEGEWGDSLEEIHEIVVKYSGIPLIGRILSGFKAQIKRFWNIGAKGNRNLGVDEPVVFNEHKKIFLALKQRNPDLAEKMMKEHINNTKKDIIEFWLNNFFGDEY